MSSHAGKRETNSIRQIQWRQMDRCYFLLASQLGHSVAQYLLAELIRVFEPKPADNLAS